MTLTTLELAERIGEAAVMANQMGSDAGQAVLRTMREHSVWFCALKQDADGIIDGDAAQVQLPLEMEP